MEPATKLNIRPKDVLSADQLAFSYTFGHSCWARVQITLGHASLSMIIGWETHALDQMLSALIRINPDLGTLRVHFNKKRQYSTKPNLKASFNWHGWTEFYLWQLKRTKDNRLKIKIWKGKDFEKHPNRKKIVISACCWYDDFVARVTTTALEVAINKGITGYHQSFHEMTSFPFDKILKLESYLDPSAGLKPQGEDNEMYRSDFIKELKWLLAKATAFAEKKTLD